MCHENKCKVLKFFPLLNTDLSMHESYLLTCGEAGDRRHGVLKPINRTPKDANHVTNAM